MKILSWFNLIFLNSILKFDQCWFNLKFSSCINCINIRWFNAKNSSYINLTLVIYLIHKNIANTSLIFTFILSGVNPWSSICPESKCLPSPTAGAQGKQRPSRLKFFWVQVRPFPIYCTIAAKHNGVQFNWDIKYNSKYSFWINVIF